MTNFRPIQGLAKWRLQKRYILVNSVHLFHISNLKDTKIWHKRGFWPIRFFGVKSCLLANFLNEMIYLCGCLSHKLEGVKLTASLYLVSARTPVFRPSLLSSFIQSFWPNGQGREKREGAREYKADKQKGERAEQIDTGKKDKKWTRNLWRNRIM